MTSPQAQTALSLMAKMHYLYATARAVNTHNPGKDNARIVELAERAFNRAAERYINMSAYPK